MLDQFTVGATVKKYSTKIVESWLGISMNIIKTDCFTCIFELMMVIFFEKGTCLDYSLEISDPHKNNAVVAFVLHCIVGFSPAEQSFVL